MNAKGLRFIADTKLRTYPAEVPVKVYVRTGTGSFRILEVDDIEVRSDVSEGTVIAIVTSEIRSDIKKSKA